MFCIHCGKQIEDNLTVCPYCNNQLENNNLEQKESYNKSRIKLYATIICILGGGFYGLHRFYLGYKKSGMTMLLIAISILLLIPTFFLLCIVLPNETRGLVVTLCGSMMFGFIMLMYIWWFIDLACILLEVLSPQDLCGALLYDSDDKKNRMMMNASLLCLFLGVFGAHEFYLGHKENAIARLIMGCIALGFVFSGISLPFSGMIEQNIGILLLCIGMVIGLVLFIFSLLDNVRILSGKFFR